MVDFAARRTMMVDSQIRPNDVTKFPVIDAMLAVPREAFVPAPRRDIAYASENVPVGPGRVLLEPRTLGKLIDGLDVQPHELVMDLGCGLGYSAAVLARLAETVVAVEEDEGMAAGAEQALADEGILNVAVLRNPLVQGCGDQAPFDVILISGGAVEQVPDAILDQLAEGGRIGAVFSEGRLGTAMLGLKVDGRVNWRYAFNAFAPVLPGFARTPGFAF